MGNNTRDFVIYGLRDPRTDEYRYVGKSTSGMSRPKMHLICSHNKDVNNWIKDLSKINECPFIDIFEKCEKEEMLRDREKHWVAECLKTGNELYNINLLSSVDVINKTNIDSKNRIEADKNYKELIKIIPILESFKKIIRNKRLSIGMTQEELSKKSKLHRSTICILESEEDRNISLASMIAIIKALLNEEDKNYIVSIETQPRQKMRAGRIKNKKSYSNIETLLPSLII